MYGVAEVRKGTPGRDSDMFEVTEVHNHNLVWSGKSNLSHETRAKGKEKIIKKGLGCPKESRLYLKCHRETLDAF